MAYEVDPLEDGDDLTAASVTDALGAAKTWVDALTPAQSMRRGAVNHVQTGKLFPTGGDALTAKNDDELQNYTFATFGASIAYNAYGADGGSDLGANLGSGDRAIIGHPSCPGYTGEDAQLTLNGGTGWLIGETRADRVTGVLVLLNVDVDGVVQNAAAREIMVCIQYKLSSSATWWTIEESESFISHTDHVDDPTSTEDLSYDIPIATLIDDVVVDENGTPATDRLVGIRAMVSCRTAVAGVSFTLQRWNLTAIPIFATRTVL